MKLLWCPAFSKSWDINTESDNNDEVRLRTNLRSMEGNGSSSWKKLKLLLWKNFKIQMRHKWQTLVELLIPLIFIVVLVVIRIIIPTQDVLQPTVYPPFKITPPYETLFLCDEIYYTPKNNVTDGIISLMKKSHFEDEGILDWKFTGFPTEFEMVKSYLIAADSIKPGDDLVDINFATVSILAAIVFENNFTDNIIPHHIKYKLRFPSSLRGDYDLLEEKTGLKGFWYTEVAYPLIQLVGPRARNKTTGGIPGYFEEGFLFLQNALDQTIMSLIMANSSIINGNNVNVKLQRFPYIPYSFDLYNFALQAFLPMLMLLSYIYPVINISKTIVLEKQSRQKESMKMMGLPNWLHWMATFIKSYVSLAISSLFLTILLKVRIFESQPIPIIPKTDATLVYFILLILSIKAVSYGFFVSSLFSNADNTATFAAFSWAMLYIPFLFLQPRYNLISFSTKIWSSFFTNSAISFACQIISLFESNGEGLQWSSIFEGSGPDDNFSLAYCLLMMIVNSFIYFTLTFYLDAVFPGEYGIPLPFNFFLTKRYWMQGYSRNHQLVSPSSQNNGENENDRIERIPQDNNMEIGIQIQNLTKTFNEKIAVKELNLDIYKGQITALLGHNGAGKTTTVSVLTGLFPPSSGTAIINGYDIEKSINSVRSSLGICPQHNVLFDELTVAEHLEFFCLLKGMDKDAVDNEINKLVASLGLESKRDAQSHTLSGGQKRKLSVLIAFCAGSKIVLLDECTSGMDSGSRRMTWDLIQNEKAGRTIILSTHFMDEADVLADRIAIIGNGKLQCCGSSLFLKKLYGVGYHLTLVKTPSCDVNIISNLLKDKIPEIELDQNVGAELSYILPDSGSHLFSSIFEEIENRAHELGIASYGASITTMEEVFMKVLKQSEIDSEKDHVPVPQLQEPSESLILSNNRFITNTGFTRHCQQFWAMIVKKLIYGSRNPFLFSLQFLIPHINMTLILLALSAIPGFSNSPSLNLSSLNSYERTGPTTTLVNCASMSSKMCQSFIDHVSEMNFQIKKVPTNESVQSSLLKAEQEKLTFVTYRNIVAYEEEVLEQGNRSNLEIIGYFNNQAFHAAPLVLNFISNAILKEYKYTIEISNHPLPYSSLDTIKDAGGVMTLGFQVGFHITMLMTSVTATYVVVLIRERITGCKHLQFVSGVRTLIYWSANILLDFIYYMVPCFGFLLLLNLYNIEEFNQKKIQLIYLLIMASFGFSIIPFQYWVSVFFTNPTTGYSRMIIFNAFAGLTPMAIMVFIKTPGLHLEHLGDKLNNWFLISPHYAMGQSLVQVSTNFHLSRFCEKFEFIETVCDNTGGEFNDNFCCTLYSKNGYLDWSSRMGIGKNLTALVISGFVYCFLLFCVEFDVLKKIKNLYNEGFPDVTVHDEVKLPEDSDVLAENKRIQENELSTLFQSENLVVRNLLKTYNNIIAVNHINFSVGAGQCFGLLGVNGAGKTTTFKQLTGDIEISSGDAFVCGNSVRKKLRDVHENIGYTPQFDGLIDEATGRETIRMFARLKGVPQQNIESLIEELGQLLAFSEHLDKWACNLSGGNKRKLSTACSLVGKPPVILLDEPSSGMDPVARRSLWNAICRLRDIGTSVVLTTHSLEEAEALCTKIGIMVNGKFRCLGSPQQLINKYSKGYTLIAQIKVKMNDETRIEELENVSNIPGSIQLQNRSSHWESDLENLRNFIENAFPGCILKDTHPGFLLYHIMPNEGISWGRMFAIMEEAKTKFALEAYSVGQTTLEQVFLNFIKDQVNNE